jgi:hypothetical protein
MSDNDLRPDPAHLPATTTDDAFGFVAPTYDPAEYRWVPVRRRPRRDGWTEEKQRRFIEVLADTGLVGAAAKEVGMTRASAYRLRRAAHAGAFARAWDRARELAGAMIEDIAFERAIEGVEVETFDRDGELAGTRTVYNDRLLTFLLRHLRPEVYSAAARERRGGALSSVSGSERQEPDAASLDAALRAMEPPLPASVEELVDPDQLETDLLTAEIADGALPRFLSEQRPVKSPERLRAEELAAQQERGRLADIKREGGGQLTHKELEDWCVYIDPTAATEVPAPRKRRGKTRTAR